MNVWNEFKFLESEMLSELFSFSCNIPLKNIGLQPNTINIFRGENYEIVIEAHGKGAKGHGHLNRNLKKGQSIVGEDYEFQFVNHKVILYKAIGNGLTINGGGEFKLGLLVRRVSDETDLKEKIKTVTEYFVGCPEIQWSGHSERKMGKKASLERGVSSKLIKHSLSSQSESFSSDCAFLENKYGKIVFSKFANEKNDKGSCYLEFDDAVTGIDKSYRENWAEALSFFIGKRLISVGFKNFTEQGWLKYQEAYSAYSPNFNREINSPALPPVGYWDQRGFNDDKKIGDLIELYLENQTQLSLSDALEGMWVGKTMPIGLGLVAFSSSLEVLINAWFKLKKTKNSGLIVDEEEFNSKTSNWIENFEKSIPSNDGWKSIVKKIKNSNFVVGSDKFKIFFKEINLPTGPVEKTVIDSRHKMAHGGSLEGAELRKYILISRAYQTLISRVVLKVIGYSGKYIDYSTYDFPERNINEPLGGPMGDGKI